MRASWCRPFRGPRDEYPLGETNMRLNVLFFPRRRFRIDVVVIVCSRRERRYAYHTTPAMVIVVAITRGVTYSFIVCMVYMVAIQPNTIRDSLSQPIFVKS